MNGCWSDLKGTQTCHRKRLSKRSEGITVKITLQKSGQVLAAYAHEDLAWIDKLNDGQIIVIQYTRSRNPQYHRYAMKMMRVLHDMVDETMGFDPWRRLMTVKAGYFDAVGKVLIDGTVQSSVIPHSIAFEKMDQDDFREYFNNVLQAFSDKYGKELTYDQLYQWAMM